MPASVPSVVQMAGGSECAYGRIDLSTSLEQPRFILSLELSACRTRNCDVSPIAVPERKGETDLRSECHVVCGVSRCCERQRKIRKLLEDRNVKSSLGCIISGAKRLKVEAVDESLPNDLI